MGKRYHCSISLFIGGLAPDFKENSIENRAYIDAEDGNGNDDAEGIDADGNGDDDEEGDA